MSCLSFVFGMLFFVSCFTLAFSWVSALPVLTGKLPDLAQDAVAQLQDLSCRLQCVREAQESVSALQRAQRTELPTWVEAAAGAKPPLQTFHTTLALDASDFERGWQCYACSFLETTFLEHVVKPRCDESRLSLLLSQASGSASAWLRAVPSESCFVLPPLRFQVAVRRRLRWPLPLSGGPCSRCCPQELDPLGDHAAACPTAGRLGVRARPVEKTWARVLREASGRVRENFFLRDAGLPTVGPEDGRRVEVVVTGLPHEHGVPMALDATVVSCTHADGRPFPGATAGRRSTFTRAERLKRATYPELTDSSVLKLKTVACTTGGAWNNTALDVLAEAADARARSEVPVLRTTARRAWCQRWTGMLSVCVQSSLAATLVNDGASLLEGSPQDQPLSLDVWLGASCGPAAAAAASTVAAATVPSSVPLATCSGHPSASTAARLEVSAGQLGERAN